VIWLKWEELQIPGTTVGFARHWISVAQSDNVGEEDPHVARGADRVRKIRESIPADASYAKWEGRQTENALCALLVLAFWLTLPSQIDDTHAKYPVFDREEIVQYHREFQLYDIVSFRPALKRSEESAAKDCRCSRPLPWQARPRCVTHQQDGSGDIDTYEVMQLFRKIGEKIPRKAAQAIIEQFSLVSGKPPPILLAHALIQSLIPDTQETPTGQHSTALSFDIQMLAVGAHFFVRDVEKIAGWPLLVTHPRCPIRRTATAPLTLKSS
jgi:hypothetical protein